MLLVVVKDVVDVLIVEERCECGSSSGSLTHLKYDHVCLQHRFPLLLRILRLFQCTKSPGNVSYASIDIFQGSLLLKIVFAAHVYPKSHLVHSIPI